MRLKDKNTGRFIKDRVKIICFNCRLEFESTPKGNIKYCSWVCYKDSRNKKNLEKEKYLSCVLEMRKTMKIKDMAVLLKIDINTVRAVLRKLEKQGLFKKHSIIIKEKLIPSIHFKNYKDWLAKHRTSEYRKALSDSRLGEKGSNYMGGVTKTRLLIRNSYRYRTWRAKIKERDNDTCQLCGISNVSIEVDHIISLVELLEKFNIKTTKEATNCEELWNMNNGRVLCLPCHRQTKNYGWSAYHLKRKSKYFKNKKLLEEPEIIGIIN